MTVPDLTPTTARAPANGVHRPPAVTAAGAEEATTVGRLAGIVADALSIYPPRYTAAILGRPRSWLPPFRRYSEFQLLNLWHLRSTLRFLKNVTIPSIPRTPPPFGPPFVNDLFWHPTVILQRPDHIGSYTSFPDEAWFLVNGVMTDDAVAQLNAAFISYLFHRPVTLIQNSPDSLLIDLLQCAVGKAWYRTTEPAAKAFPVLYDALKDPHRRRVVVLAHSQGTIIMATVLRLLYAITERAGAELAFAARGYAPPVFVYPDDGELDLGDFAPLTEEELAKLEVYSFATCANEMTYFRGGDRPVPFLAHFGNEFDIVARLGMLAPRPRRWGIAIDGPRHVHRGTWGHLLNAHYLFAVADCQKKGHRRGGGSGCAPYAAEAGTPRLFAYINGGRPAV